MMSSLCFTLVAANQVTAQSHALPALWLVIGIIIVALFLRYSSLAAIVSAVFAPAYAFFMSLLGFDPGSMLPAVVLTSALLVWRHKSNILNLVAGREGRIGEKRD